MGRAEFGTPIFAAGSVAAVGLVGILRTGRETSHRRA